MHSRYRTHSCLHIVAGYPHAQQCSDGVEGLRQVQSLGGRFLAAHAVNVGVATGFQERQAARHDEVGHQERIVVAQKLCRDEHQRAYGEERQPQ